MEDEKDARTDWLLNDKHLNEKKNVNFGTWLIFLAMIFQQFWNSGEAIDFCKKCNLSAKTWNIGHALAVNDGRAVFFIEGMANHLNKTKKILKTLGVENNSKLETIVFTWLIKNTCTV